MRVYLLDVNRPDLEYLSAVLLRTAQVDIVGTSFNPVEAMEEIGRLKPDVLFMELQFPELHGLAIAEQVKRSFPLIHVVIVTRNRHYALWAFDQQMTDYVLKPFDEERLRQVVRRLETI